VPLSVQALAAAINLALQTWQADRTGHLIRYARLVAAETDIDEFARAQVEGLLQGALLNAATWVIGKLVDAGERIDQWLTHDWIESPRLRAWLEEHDNPTAALLAVLAEFEGAIAEAAREVQARDSEEVTREIARRFLEGGATAGFLNLSGPSPETPRPSGSQRGGLVAIEEQTALAVIGPSVAELAAENDELHRLLTAREDELGATLAELAERENRLADARADLRALLSGDGADDDLPPSSTEEKAADEPSDLGATSTSIEAEIIAEEDGLLSLPLPDLLTPYDVPDNRTPAERARDAVAKDRTPRPGGHSIEQTASRAPAATRPLRRSR
jgi:hypothetical protein